MTTLREAAQQALEALKDDQYRMVVTAEGHREYKTDLAITALENALAQEQADPPGCEHCNHPLYAATKCRVCGRVTEQAEPTYKTYPIRMNFEWVGDRWLFDGNPIDNGEWCVTLGDSGWMIYPKMEQAEPVQEPLAKVIATAPTRIWLDLGFDPADEDITFEQLFEATWSQDNATGWGIEYVRADVAAPPQRKPLTNKEIMDLCASKWASHPVEVARLIEQAHGIV